MDTEIQRMLVNFQENARMIEKRSNKDDLLASRSMTA
jgi:hypothetical protein